MDTEVSANMSTFNMTVEFELSSEEPELFPGGVVPSLDDICKYKLSNPAMIKLCNDYRNYMRFHRLSEWIHRIGVVANIIICILGVITNTFSFVIICQGAFVGSMRIYFLALAGILLS